jgi:magnesium-transporting ATPase (P-type)
MLVTIAAAPAAHFLAILLQSYFINTSTLYIFVIIYGNMPFFSWFFNNNIFLYILLGWIVLTFAYLLLKKDKKRLNLEDMFEK